VCVVVGTWRGWASQEEDCHQTMSFFFHFILKIKREIRGGKFFDFFFCWANDLLGEKTIENAPSVFSLFFSFISHHRQIWGCLSLQILHLFILFRLGISLRVLTFYTPASTMAFFLSPN
jgi:hypothetical protein